MAPMLFPARGWTKTRIKGEFGGIMGVLHIVQCHTIVHNVQTGKLRLGLDGLVSRNQGARRTGASTFWLKSELCVCGPRFR
jgi:hypothetical protein